MIFSITIFSVAPFVPELISNTSPILNSVVKSVPKPVSVSEFLFAVIVPVIVNFES